MDTATREIVRQEKAARKDAQAAERKRQLAERQTIKQLDAAKRAAVRDVREVGKATAKRWSSIPGKWAREGTVVRACNWAGPHNEFWCLFHGQKLVTLVRVPRARGGCTECSRYVDYGYYSNFSRDLHLGIHLGSDGVLYRYGHTKIFKAKLMDRDHASDIRALIPKLIAME